MERGKIWHRTNTRSCWRHICHASAAHLCRFYHQNSYTFQIVQKDPCERRKRYRGSASKRLESDRSRVRLGPKSVPVGRGLPLERVALSKRIHFRDRSPDWCPPVNTSFSCSSGFTFQLAYIGDPAFMALRNRCGVNLCEAVTTCCNPRPSQQRERRLSSRGSSLHRHTSSRPYVKNDKRQLLRRLKWPIRQRKERCAPL